MKFQLPRKPFLSKALAIKASENAELLTKSQICDCIEVLSGVTLAPAEKRQGKPALLMLLRTALTIS